MNAVTALFRTEPRQSEAQMQIMQPFQSAAYFFSSAQLLREQFESQIRQAEEVNDGLTPLLYGFSRNAYQFLTATAERIFSRELLQELMSRMRSWAIRPCGRIICVHPSITRLRQWLPRDLLCDSTDARWHWMLPLGLSTNKKNGTIKLLSGPSPSIPANDSLSLEQLLEIQLRFNQLPADPSTNAYSVEPIDKG